MKGSFITYKPIGIIHSEHIKAERTPIQPAYARGCKGWAEIFQEFEDGLSDLEGFAYIYLIYHFNKAGPAKLKVKTFSQGVARGVFSTRAAGRPNAVGLSIVELLRREKNLLFLDDVDVLDGTPLLDIKPYYYTGWRNRVPPLRTRLAASPAPKRMDAKTRLGKQCRAGDFRRQK